MKILLVEDDDRVAEFLIRGLTAEGFMVQWARDGVSGFGEAAGGQFDVVVLDLMLPGMDGREVCQKLRMLEIDTKILMLSALETTSDVVRGLRMGADDYLTKPFAFEELVARLEVLARRPSVGVSENAHVLRAGPLSFDTSALTVTFHGKPVDLTSLEYALLEFLMNEKGKVVSRARILQNVWGAHEDPLTNVVDVYVRRLRAKFSEHGPEEIITTIRGRGYRLSAL